MKDGFDKSVAQKMPKIQKKRPNRPWNVDPVLIKAQEEERARSSETRQDLDQQTPEVKEAPLAPVMDAVAGAVESAPPVQDPIQPEPAMQAPTPQDAPAAVEIGEVPTSGEASARIHVAEVDEALSIKGLVSSEAGNLARAVETIKDLSSDFTQIVFERKAIQQKLDQSARIVEETARENALLKARLQEYEREATDNTLIEREIDFLNEQLEDADLYIKNMMNLLEEKEQAIETESSRRREIEGRFEKISGEIRDKAKLDVKVSILERDLGISHARLRELESRLEEEYRKREPLEQEIMELKNALDRVYSSLAQIRLKAKREVYGS
jgi:hypothetical protein